MATLLIGIFLPAVGRVQAFDPSEEASQDSLSANDSRRYDYFFIEAVRQQNAENYTAAFDLLNRCIAINPKAAEAYYLRAMYFSELGNDTMALADIERAAALSPNNDTYQERVAQYYIGTRDYDRAISAYEKLYELHRDRTDVLNILTQLYRQQKNYTKMLSTVERMEQVDGTSDELTLTKMNIYEMKGEKQKAREQLQNLVQIHPNDASYKVMFGNWLLQNEHKDEAYKMFTAALNDDPDNESAQSSMYDYYRSVGQDSLADTVRDRVLLSKKISTKTKLTMILSLISDSEKAGGDSTAVLKVFDDIMKVTPNDVDIALMKAAYMSKKEMPDTAMYNVYSYILDISPDNAAARLQLIQMLWQQQKWQEIIDLASSGTQYNPDEMAFYYFLGLAHYQVKEEDAALDAFKRGVGEIDDQSDPAIVSDFYAIMGDILYSKKLPDEAFAAYDSCLQWKQDNIACLNNYAYYLSEMGLDLRKAEQMSYQAVNAEPNNSTYLDTYAWILYMQDRYDEAKNYIDQALAVDTDSVQSAVVIEHAGDIYAVNGDRQRAEELWQQAIKAGGNKDVLTKKIKRKKFVKKAKKH